MSLLPDVGEGQFLGIILVVGNHPALILAFSLKGEGTPLGGRSSHTNPR